MTDTQEAVEAFARFRHVIFHDHPGALDETDGATGILQPRFIGKV
jgi:hypothetical protein